MVKVPPVISSTVISPSLALIANLLISFSIPEKVKVALAGNILNIEGPLGKKSLDIDLDTFNLDIKEGKEISIKPKKIDQVYNSK